MIRMDKIKNVLCNTCGTGSHIDDIEQTKNILRNDLFQINPINKSVNRDILSLAYSPGVAQVCLQIKDHPEEVDNLTMRGRSVAIVSDGSMLDSEGKSFMPVMDWFVAQLKYYGGVDAFPFVIRKKANLEEFIKDVSTSYGTVLYLDSNNINNIPDNLLLLKQQQISKYFDQEITDASQTALIIANLIQKKVKGIAKQSHFNQSKTYKANNFQNKEPFDYMLHDNRSLKEHAIEYHRFYKGKIMIELNFRDISKIRPYFSEATLRKLAKQQDPYSKTRNLSAIVTDGTAILGLGNIGPVAGLPVMEGKSLLFKTLGDVDVVPFCFYPRKTGQEQVQLIDNCIGYFRAINLQDIKAPQCFTVERGLKKMKELPIFHDDQHGTAIVVLAGLINAFRLAKKEFKNAKVVVNGAGAAGATIARLLLDYGVSKERLIICDSKGAIYKGRQAGMNSQKDHLAEIMNTNQEKGSLEDVLHKCDAFVGVSAAGALKKQWIKTMANKPIIFALANPDPQILPDQAKQGGAFIYASGRSDFQNQINNSLVFPGIFKGILKHGLQQINDQMKLLAAQAVANSLTKEATETYIIPDSLDRDVTLKIAEEIKKGKK